MEGSSEGYQDVVIRREQFDTRLEDLRVKYEADVQKKYADLILEKPEYVEWVWQTVDQKDGDELEEYKKGVEGHDLEFFEAVQEISSEFKKVDSEKKDFEKSVLPQEVENYETSLMDLVSRIDYDLMVQHYFSRDADLSGNVEFQNLLYDVAVVRNYQNELAKGGDDYSENWQDVAQRKTHLLALKAKFAEKNFLRPNRDQNYDLNEVTDPETDVNLVLTTQKRIAKTMEDLNEYKKLSRFLKPNQNTHLAENEIFKAKTMLRIVGNLTNKDFYRNSSLTEDLVTKADPRLIAAINKYAEKTALGLAIDGMLPQTDNSRYLRYKNREQIDRTKVLEGIKFEGFDDDPKSFVTEKYVKTMLSNFFPAEFIGHIKSMALTPKEIDAGNGGVHAGLNTLLFNSRGEYVGSEIEFYRENKPRPEDTAATIAYKQNKATSTVWHEIGHGTAMDLTFDEMKEWLSIKANSPESITWYANATDEANGKDAELAINEDLCESFAMFVENPALLTALSEERFAFMMMFFQNHSTKEEFASIVTFTTIIMLSQKAAWQDSGMSAEDVAKLWRGIENI